MSNNFSVCTYNLGSSAGDYLQLCKFLKPDLKITSKKEEEPFISKYNETEKQTAELLTGRATAYCLQEVGDEERPLIRSLKKGNFEIVHIMDGRILDTAIAIDKGRFKDIINHSIDVRKKDVAIATATDILSGEKVTFVSAHTPGFNFTDFTEYDTLDGDLYCRDIATKLSEIGSGTIQVIGADMNANPEKWNRRFQIFSDQGFELHRANSPTNVNPRDLSDQEREIDFIFTKTTLSLWQKIKSIFVSTFQSETLIKNEKSPLSWNAEENASDHLPVFVDISYKTNISKIRQLWNGTCDLIASCFRNKSLKTV